MIRLRSIHLRLSVISLSVLTVFVFFASLTVATIDRRQSSAQQEKAIQPIATTATSNSAIKNKQVDEASLATSTETAGTSATPTTVPTAPTTPTTKTTKPAPATTQPATNNDGPYGKRCTNLLSQLYGDHNNSVIRLNAEHNANVADLEADWQSGAYVQEFGSYEAHDFYQADLDDEFARWQQAGIDEANAMKAVLSNAGCAYYGSW